MDLKFPCPTCGTELTVDETAAGQTFACPACQGSVVVPASQPTRTSGPPPSSTAAPPPPSSAGRSSAAPPPPSSSGKSAAPPPPSGSGGSAPPTQRQYLPPPSAEGEALAPEDAVMDEPEHGSYSAGFLAQTIDNKMAQLRGTTNSFFWGSVRRTISSLGIFAYWWWRCCGWARVHGMNSRGMKPRAVGTGMPSRWQKRPRKIPRKGGGRRSRRYLCQNHQATLPGTLLRMPQR